MRTYKPREWPNKHKEARDDAATEVAAALKTTIDLLEIEIEPEKLRQHAKIIFHLQNALRHLEGAGACTKPRTIVL